MSEYTCSKCGYEWATFDYGTGCPECYPQKETKSLEVLSLSRINDDIVKIRRRGEVASFIIVGQRQWYDLCSWIGGSAYIIDQTVKESSVFGLKLIRLNKIDDYYEVQ